MSATVTVPPPSPRLPFDLADLHLLSPTDAKVILKRFEFLVDFLMHAPGAATAEEKRLLLQAIEVLQEIVQA
jgi:hypothetical protein